MTSSVTSNVETTAKRKFCRLSRCYAEALDGTVYHYHDASGLECDAIVHLRNGSYGLIEIKLGGERLVEEGVKTLEALSAKIDSTRMRSPSFRMVVVANGDVSMKAAGQIYGIIHKTIQT